MYIYFVPIIIIVASTVLMFLLMRRKFQSNLRQTIGRGSSRKKTTSHLTVDELSEENLLLEAVDSYEKHGNIGKAIESLELYLYRSKNEDEQIFSRLARLYTDTEPEKARYYWKKAAELGYKPAIEMLEHDSF